MTRAETIGPEGRRASDAPAERSGAAVDGPLTPVVSVILPTYNEAANLPVVVDRLTTVLADFDFEIVIVDDDSPDRTWHTAAELATLDHRIRTIRRFDRRGLSSAVLDGMAQARGEVLAVMDADLQHDEAALPAIVQMVLEGQADICLGSRGVEGGDYGQFGPIRRLLSFWGALLARLLLGTTVSDPMSGYFAVSRSRYEAVRSQANPKGFKVLLELMSRGPKPTVAEVGYSFRNRRAGETKLSPRVMATYLVALGELTLTRLSSLVFINYAAVAITALSIRVSLGSSLLVFGFDGPIAFLAFEVAILAEFIGHNNYTFVTSRHRGLDQLGPLIAFHLVSLYGIVAMVGVESLVERWSAATTAGLPIEKSVTAAVLLLGFVAVAVSTVIALGYNLNKVLTWPGQTKRPTTELTSPAISSTARR